MYIYIRISVHGRGRGLLLLTFANETGYPMPPLAATSSPCALIASNGATARLSSAVMNVYRCKVEGIGLHVIVLDCNKHRGSVASRSTLLHHRFEYLELYNRFG